MSNKEAKNEGTDPVKDDIKPEQADSGVAGEGGYGGAGAGAGGYGGADAGGYGGDGAVADAGGSGGAGAGGIVGAGAGGHPMLLITVPTNKPAEGFNGDGKYY